MQKRFIFIACLLLALVIVGVWAPWRNWNFDLAQILGAKRPEKFATLQVSSISGEVTIYIDGEERGSVGPEGSPFMIEDVKPGQRLVKLVRVSDDQRNYINFERLLQFTENNDTVIAYELGPTEEFSAGHVISAYKSYANDNKTKLSVKTTPDNVKVSLNDKELGNSPQDSIELNLNEVQTLKLSKAGYEDMVINLLPQSQQDRDNLKGYDIVVEANLFLKPIEVEES
jgi:hypothetical protein